MKEQIISERANIIANLRQLVQSLVELNMRAKTHVSSNKADIKKLRKDNKELEKIVPYTGIRTREIWHPCWKKRIHWTLIPLHS